MFQKEATPFQADTGKLHKQLQRQLYALRYGDGIAQKGKQSF
jgi:hypothetical protein